MYQPRILSKAQSYGIGLTDTGPTPQLFFCADGCASSAAIYVDKWIFIAATYDRQSMRIYTNGVRAAQTAGSAALSVNNFPIGLGRNLESGTDWVKGGLDDLRVYNRALSDSEVNDLYDYEKAPKPPAGSLYYFIPGSFTWAEAKADAERRGGHLAAISSEIENAIIAELSGGVMWIGGYQLPDAVEPADGWTWVTEEPFAFQAWANGQPDNAGGRQSALAINFSTHGGWDDAFGPTASGYASGYALELPAPLSATAVATVTLGYVSSVEVVTGGSGYSGEPSVIFSGGGGSGAVAKAVLIGDKVGQIIVLSSGSGYTTAPVVLIEAPKPEVVLGVRLVPEITVFGPPGTAAKVEWSATLGQLAKWELLTVVALDTDGATVVDLAVGSTTRFYRAVTLPPAPGSMTLIPAGSFQMGDTFNDGFLDELPVHSVFVSTFYVDKTEVTKGFWDEVKDWSGGNGFGFDNPGLGKGTNHPVHGVSWFDVVKWCNARSQREGRVAAYYTDALLTQVYKTGQVSPYVKWEAGYRLPTETEWERAARGGASGHRFPWSEPDTITHGRANYLSRLDEAYDVSATRGYNPLHAVGGEPFTSPVGSFAANGYGLFDMAGNVREWCWDWHGSYSSGSQTDPRGPASGLYRVFRGGTWSYYGFGCRSAYRYYFAPDFRDNSGGFRSVLPLSQP